MFNIVCLENDQIVESGITDGFIASLRANDLTSLTGKKHQPRKVAEMVNWRERERCRFLNGTYTALPWVGETWYHRKCETLEHYAHVSKNNPGKLAFTENEEKGRADVQTQMRPGRYLRNYYEDVAAGSTIELWANKFASLYEPIELKFATTADEIEFVYRNGPHSCMVLKGNEYHSPFHPTRIYAAGDLAIAYLSYLENEKERITARAVCWPEKKIFGRIYGDSVRLDAALTRAGYSNGLMNGARLRKVEVPKHEDKWVAPYLDGTSLVRIEEEYLVIDPQGHVCCGNSDGFTSPVHRCQKCRNIATGNSLHTVTDISNHDHAWCMKCIESQAFRCQQFHRYYEGTPIKMANGQNWSSAAFKQFGFKCDATHLNHTREDRIRMANGSFWSRQHFTTHGHHCYLCNRNFPLEEKCDCNQKLIAGHPFKTGDHIVISNNASRQWFNVDKNYMIVDVISCEKYGKSYIYTVKRDDGIEFAISAYDVLSVVDRNLEPGDWIYVGGESFARWLVEPDLPVEPARVKIREKSESQGDFNYLVETPRGATVWVYNKDILGKAPKRRMRGAAQESQT